ncbi:Rieske Fe-S protein, partial [Arthrobacter sp. CG_A4]|nr:Rieske Fe-S protein [Arthrobacter sp. CG_A4]
MGGNGHPVGREHHTRAQVDDLQRWAVQHFPGGELSHSWSAQDYEPAGAVPYVGAVPWSGNVHTATGYNKWGMTNGVAAALALSADILGGDSSWARILFRTRISAHDAASTVQANNEVAVEMISGWLGGLARTRSVNPPEGQGVVVRDNGRPVGLCTVQGKSHKVSVICPHLGGVLGWNDAEQSWDCPLHGSRFTADGQILEGPATRELGHPVLCVAVFGGVGVFGRDEKGFLPRGLDLVSSAA